MEIIIKEPGAGKTFDLIKKSAQSWSYIVCFNQVEAIRVFNEALSNGYEIPMPITFTEFLNDRYNARGVRGFLIDNLDMLLSFLSKVPIEAVTLTNTHNDEPAKINELKKELS